ncbi:uncharacterized protein FOMMEDRAFT_157332 [Fomitiporia mediterranea MF3/22]|uniref:uncharacterized protein n=1 Tax=Fomitiporia mediterranea (strain MF3/22) TaxID=694068 RepID=UPI0004407DC4|nr:uncharacterized protein FOMMEDRAFT_157332 [Fomitiporia mediterranea MF3/22]EJD02140.1 hypothetical protein FOMMEDRAFT_157332 [Fomitiporia mediterranea MF3/22]
MPHTCDICAAVIGRKYDLEHRHARIHTGEAHWHEHFCAYHDCPRSTHGFSQKGNLNAHVNSRHAQGAEKRWYTCRREGCTKTFADASVRIRHEKNARAHSTQFAQWCATDQATHTTQESTGDATVSRQVSGLHAQGYKTAGSSNMRQDVNPGQAMRPPSSNQVAQALLPHFQAFQFATSSTIPDSSEVDGFVPALQPGPGFDRRSSSVTTFQSSTLVLPYGQDLPSRTQAAIKPDPEEEYLYPQTQTGTSVTYESPFTGDSDININQWSPSSPTTRDGLSTATIRHDLPEQPQSPRAGPGPSSSSNLASSSFDYHQWDRY